MVVLPIADRHAEYARSVRDRLAAAGLRVELDERQEKIGYKIREAQLQKVPYMLVTGDREAAEATVAVRSRAGGDLGAKRLEAFIDEASESKCRNEESAAFDVSSHRGEVMISAEDQNCPGGSLSLSTEARAGTTARG